MTAALMPNDTTDTVSRRFQELSAGTPKSFSPKTAAVGTYSNTLSMPVVAGAAIGVASAEAGYWIGDIILGKGKKKKQDVSLSVAPMGMTLVARL